jgi:ribonucleoside-diphosphate reductase alpha chain
VKPSGTASLELGCVGSGIHYHHARRYFRRVTANPNEPIAKAFSKHNPHMVETKPNGDLCITFPIMAPDGAKVVKEESALEFIDHVFTVYDSWIRPGSETDRNKLPLTHNVSCTVVVKDGEWESVTEKVWTNRHRITAMSFLPAIGDKLYPFAPREEVVTEADEAKWNYLIDNYKPLNYELLEEQVDATHFTQDPACAGGVCEV